jgi:ribosomal protein S4
MLNIQLGMFNFEIQYMKYKRLTKEQQDELHQEFATFLASQSIDKKEWDEIKSNKPEIAEQELDVFSDLIWEGVLTNAKFLEHFSKNHIFLFHFQKEFIQSMVIKSLVGEVDFLAKDGLQWLSDNLFTETVEIHVGKKEYDKQRNEAIFDLITQGAILSDGQLYIQINTIIQS